MISKCLAPKYPRDYCRNISFTLIDPDRERMARLQHLSNNLLFQRRILKLQKVRIGCFSLSFKTR